MKIALGKASRAILFELSGVEWGKNKC